MDIDKAINIFEELLQDWQVAHSTVIHEYGELEEYEELKDMIEEYRQRFYNAIKS